MLFARLALFFIMFVCLSCLSIRIARPPVPIARPHCLSVPPRACLSHVPLFSYCRLYGMSIYPTAPSVTHLSFSSPSFCPAHPPSYFFVRRARPSMPSIPPSVSSVDPSHFSVGLACLFVQLIRSSCLSVCPAGLSIGFSRPSNHPVCLFVPFGRPSRLSIRAFHRSRRSVHPSVRLVSSPAPLICPTRPCIPPFQRALRAFLFVCLLRPFVRCMCLSVRSSHPSVRPAHSSGMFVCLSFRRKDDTLAPIPSLSLVVPIDSPKCVGTYVQM